MAFCWENGWFGDLHYSQSGGHPHLDTPGPTNGYAPQLRLTSRDLVAVLVSLPRDFYRIAWRNMAAHTGERTLTPAIIPPGTAHVDGVFSVGRPGISPHLL